MVYLVRYLQLVSEPFTEFLEFRINDNLAIELRSMLLIIIQVIILSSVERFKRVQFCDNRCIPYVLVIQFFDERARARFYPYAH